MLRSSLKISGVGLVLLAVVSACVGPPGEQGETGPPGPAGSSPQEAFYAGTMSGKVVNNEDQVVYEYEIFDDGDNYNPPEGYTAPSDGVYQFNVQVRYAGVLSTGSQIGFLVRVNGANKRQLDQQRCEGATCVQAGVGDSTILRLAAGDVVSVHHWGSTVTTQASGDQSGFSGYQIYASPASTAE